MASVRSTSRRLPDNESSIAYVQMDGLVITNYLYFVAE